MKNMNFFSLVVTILGLILFETISSIDNAIINAEVLSTMQAKARRWFLVYGMLISVLAVRGLLPWLIVWSVLPSLGPIGALTATFSNDPRVLAAIETSSPLLLVGGGIFLVFLFFHWLFLEPKSFGLKGERFFAHNGVWFFAVVSLILTVTVWLTIKLDPLMALGAAIGSSAFFITHGFKENAAEQERALKQTHLTDLSKILYLEIIDATFSIDGVLGAFAFTLSVPLILLGNGIGVIVVRQLTIGNIERIKKYRYLKNGAMYSVFVLGLVMLLESFGIEIKQWVSPVITFIIIGYFFCRSWREQSLNVLIQS